MDIEVVGGRSSTMPPLRGDSSGCGPTGKRMPQPHTPQAGRPGWPLPAASRCSRPRSPRSRKPPAWPRPEASPWSCRWSRSLPSWGGNPTAGPSRIRRQSACPRPRLHRARGGTRAAPGWVRPPGHRPPMRTTSGGLGAPAGQRPAQRHGCGPGRRGHHQRPLPDGRARSTGRTPPGWSRRSPPAARVPGSICTPDRNEVGVEEP